MFPHTQAGIPTRMFSAFVTFNTIHSSNLSVTHTVTLNTSAFLDLTMTQDRSQQRILPAPAECSHT